MPFILSKLAGVGKRFCDALVMWKQAAPRVLVFQKGWPQTCTSSQGSLEVGRDIARFLQTLFVNFPLLTFFSNFIILRLYNT